MQCTFRFKQKLKWLYYKYYKGRRSGDPPPSTSLAITVDWGRTNRADILHSESYDHAMFKVKKDF